MKPPLLVGLGNPLAGDDGIGWHVADRLRQAHELDPLDVLQGDDLLRLAPELEARPLVILIDAVLGGRPGRVRPIPVPDLDARGHSAHQIPPAQALALLRRTQPAVRAVPVRFIGIDVADVRVEPRLSPALQAALETILAAVTREVRRAISHASTPR